MMRIHKEYHESNTITLSLWTAHGIGCGGARTHRHHLPLRGHEGGSVADAQLGLQGVEADLQLALLLHLGRLVHAPVVPEVLQLPLHLSHGLLRGAVLQPGGGAADPLQQLLEGGREEGRRMGGWKGQNRWEVNGYMVLPCVRCFKTARSLSG